MKTVAIIDYEMGNLRSVAQAVLHVAKGENVDVVVTDDPQVVRRADRLILPGQGAMPDCMRKFRESGLLEAVVEAVRSKPLFGVCVGMQMLLDGSEEGAQPGAYTPALGLVAGKVKRFQLSGQHQKDGSRFKIPQMGWNRVRQTQKHPLWQGIADDAWFYFVHSYYAHPDDARHSAGETVYGQAFTSAIARDNLFATQFHPEKSADAGLALYRNFLHWSP